MVKDIFANLNAAVANTMSNDIKMIDIDELHSSEDNFFEIERIEEFAETILGQGGVKENLIVTPLPTGGYEIISGHRRTAAIRYLLNKGEIVQRVLPCLVQNFKSDDDKMLNLVFMNVSARRLSDDELWKSYKTVDAILKKKKEAGEKFGKIREALAGYLGVSAAQVGKLQNVDNNAISEVKEAVENGDISIFTANEIAKLNEDEQETIVATEDLSNIKPKDIKKHSTEKVDTSSNYPDVSNLEKSATSSNYPDIPNSKKSATSSNYPDIPNSEKSATSSNYPDILNSEKSATSSNYPDIPNSEKSATSSNYPDIPNSEKVATSSNYPTISNSEKVDTSVKFSNNTGDKKTISISDPFIVDLVEKLIERMYERDVYNYESCGKPEWMCPEKDSAEHMVGLSIYSYAKEHFPDLFPDDE